MSSLDNLNDQQKDAALCTEGPLLILAGAGSGKTSTITHRIAYLIRERGVAPYRILAVTFTNKAAKEMRDRLERMVGDASSMWILTFHSACMRILRMEHIYTGYSSSFTVYDPQDQKAVVKRILKEKNIDEKAISPAYILSVISSCKGVDKSYEEWRDENMDLPHNEKVYEVAKEYDKVLKSNNSMDFDDLLLNTVRLFKEHKEVLMKYQSRFSYVTVDEYQDTNFIQYMIVKMLSESHRNICVVGDDDQSIYQWRGADIRNILDFEKDFKNAKVVKLEENYRSTGNILKGANSVIRNNFDRKEKSLWTKKEEGEKIKYFRLDDDREEAHYTASEISRLVGTKGYSYKSFAVLYRNNAQSRRLEEAMVRRGIPYRIFGSIRYYERKEIKDILSYMRLVANPNEGESLLRILNVPKRGIGEKTLEKIQGYASAKNISLFESLHEEEVLSGLSDKQGKEIRSFIAAIDSISEEKDYIPILKVYERLLKETGYLDALLLEKTVEAEARIDNLMEFKSVIIETEKENQNINLTEFLETMVLVKEEILTQDEDDYVSLMTLHSSKGLEFPVVFITGMENGLFPSRRKLYDSSEMEEERRLCYVGMTRAKEKLYLLSANVRMLYGNMDYSEESVFIDEIDKSVLEGDYRRESKKAVRDGYSGTQYNPFEPVKKEMKNYEQEFASGDFVFHKKFGEGRVIEVTPPTITVIFQSEGVKKLALGIAPLERLKKEG